MRAAILPKTIILTKSSLAVFSVIKPVFHQTKRDKQHEIYMPNANPTLDTQRELYSIGLHWLWDSSHWVHGAF